MAQNSQGTAKRKRGKGKPFRKGESGNPGGRPKNAGEFAALISEKTKGGLSLLNKALTIAKDDGNKDQMRAIEYLTERWIGRAPQEIALTGKDGGPVKTESKVQDEPSPERIARVVGILSRAGALALAQATEGTAPADDAKADELHPPPAD